MQRRRSHASVVMLVVAALSSPAINAGQRTSSLPKDSTSVYSAQTGQQQPTSNHFPDDKSGVEPAVHERMEEQAAKARNTERFKRIQADTEKLLKLSTELKEDVDKSTKNEMSLDVIRKAAEVEKLAHDVKERMKG